MPVTIQENTRFGEFVSGIAQEAGCFDFLPEQLVWHYTNGAGFLGILQSSQLHATQVASLNDANETKHATELFINAVKQVMAERASEQLVVTFLRKLLEFSKQNSGTINVSKFFVTSFSGEGDDVTQWDRYGRPNGYAIGFQARGLFRDQNSKLYRVVYDSEKQEKAAKKLAEATVKFYLEGLASDPARDAEAWAPEFLAAWDDWVYRLAPLAKASRWKAEDEYRIVHELKPAEFPAVRFVQKSTMLARYIPLDTTTWVKRRAALLPIAKIIVGPGSNFAPTQVSVRLLLDQMGYTNVAIEESTCSLTRP
jgi:hypothetical protein